MSPSDYCRSLAADMNEARRRAGGNDDSSCWEELEGLLAQYEERLSAPRPSRRNVQAPPANIYDLEHRRALLSRGLSS